MASHGFWSLGGDNAGANPGSQSPSTSEWLFPFVFKPKTSGSRRMQHNSFQWVIWASPAGLLYSHWGGLLQVAWSLLCVSSILKLDWTALFNVSPPYLAARAWCQAAAQKLSGGIGSKLCGRSCMCVRVEVDLCLLFPPLHPHAGFTG